MDILANYDLNEIKNVVGKKPAPEALEKLKEAVSVLENFESKEDASYKKLMAITLNNIACYYKRHFYNKIIKNIDLISLMSHYNT